MATSDNYNGLVFSVKRAIYEYAAHHNGELPAYIVASMHAYSAIISGCTVRIQRKMTPLGYDLPEPTIFGIPITTTMEEGVHVRLAEPDIPIYEIPKEEPQLVLPPDYVPREG